MGDDIKIVRGMCEGGNGVFHDACVALCDEIERLRAAGDALVKALRDETVNCTMAVFNETFVALNLWTEARREQ